MTVDRQQDVTKGGMNFFDESVLFEADGGETERRANCSSSATKAGSSRATPPGTTRAFTCSVRCYSNSPKALQKSPRGEYELTDAINGMLNAGDRIAGLAIEGTLGGCA